MNAKGSVSTTNVYPANAPDTFTFSERVKSDWLLTLLARVGYDMGSWYPYVTGGAAVANFKYTNTYADPVFAIGCACTASMTAGVGPTVGGSVEYRLDAHRLVRAEYLFMYFGTLSSFSTVVSGPGFGAGSATLTHQINFSENVARLALSYKF